MRYEIDDQNHVRVWVEEQEAPVLFQPHYPNGTAWENREAAETWAAAYVAYVADPENVPFPTEPDLLVAETPSLDGVTQKAD